MTTSAGEPRTTRWNTTALVAGLVFILLGVLFLLEALEVVELRAAIVVPVLLIGLGIAVLLGGRPTPDEAGPATPVGR